MVLQARDARPNAARAAPNAEMLLSLAPGVSIAEEALLWEFLRSQGPGGQHVNKTSSRVRLKIPLGALVLEQPERLPRLRTRLAHRLDGDDQLVVTCQDSRSQHANRAEALVLAGAVIRASLVEQKRRKPTRATRGSRERRLKTKQRRAAVKRTRRAGDGD